MGKTVIVRTCPHRIGASVAYINNDGQSAPILWIDKIEGPTALSLTNTVVRVSCGHCFVKIRAALGDPLKEDAHLV